MVRLPFSQPPNHWTELHQFAPRFYRGWNADHATVFLAGWINRIPERNCDCKGKWLAMGLEIDCTTAVGFFESAWAAHDAVSLAIGKPRITLDECYAIWWRR